MVPEKKFENVDEYIDSFPRNVQVILDELRKTIKDAAPEAQEIISYQMPAFKLNGILVWFGAFKNHVSLYPKVSAINVFKKQLASYKIGKGTIQFPLDKPIPFDLVSEIVRFRVKENLSLSSLRTKYPLGKLQHEKDKMKRG